MPISDLSRFLVQYNAFGGVASWTTYNDLLFGYDGEFTDPATGMQWHSEPGTRESGRWYLPWLQRWASKDPEFPVTGSNPYEAFNDSPTNFIDPSGLYGETDSPTAGPILTLPPVWDPNYQGAQAPLIQYYEIDPSIGQTTSGSWVNVPDDMMLFYSDAPWKSVTAPSKGPFDNLPNFVPDEECKDLLNSNVTGGPTIKIGTPLGDFSPSSGGISGLSNILKGELPKGVNVKGSFNKGPLEWFVTPPRNSSPPDQP